MSAENRNVCKRCRRKFNNRFNLRRHYSTCRELQGDTESFRGTSLPVESKELINASIQIWLRFYVKSATTANGSLWSGDHHRSVVIWSPLQQQQGTELFGASTTKSLFGTTTTSSFTFSTPASTGQQASQSSELDGIRARGKNCPKPIKKWAQSGCSRGVLDFLKKYGYEKLTPIQAQAIPAVLSGRDVIGIAKTGSGKTLAFLVPMFHHIANQPPLKQMYGPIGLIVTPSQELAMQIAKECEKFSRALNLRTVCVYGGTEMSEQIAELKRGVEIIVCTPGGIIDMLAANNAKVTNLHHVTYLVLDQADGIFDMCFEAQVMKILDSVRPDRQIVMFSATFSHQVESLARKILQEPIKIEVGGRHVEQMVQKRDDCVYCLRRRRSCILVSVCISSRVRCFPYCE